MKSARITLEGMDGEYYAVTVSHKGYTAILRVPLHQYFQINEGLTGSRDIVSTEDGNQATPEMAEFFDAIVAKLNQ